MCVLQLQEDVSRFQRAVLKEQRTTCTVSLGVKLGAEGYKVSVQSARAGGSTYDSLRLSFLRVSGDLNFGTIKEETYIVDPCFR